MAKPTKPAPSMPLPPNAKGNAAASTPADPSVLTQFNIPASQIPQPILEGPNPNHINKHDVHVPVYCAPNQKFDKAAVDARCKGFVEQAMVRYRKHKIAGPINSIMFHKELRDVLSEAGIVNVDLDKVIRDGGGLPKL